MKRQQFKTKDIVFIGVSAAIIAVCAFITIPVGAIPITLQTLAVCLVAGLFGAERGTAAVVIYTLLGAVGVPVFSGLKGGIGVLAGPTGGYIFGFIFTALITGIVSDKTKKLPYLIMGMALGVAACYASGTAWFVHSTEETAALILSKTLSLCVTPFIIPDLVKIIIAAVLVNRLKDRILKTDNA